uniref:Uncharacterized protein n=1 Tax=Pelusios castaneus TaxID=367368 RepID=A0A8C8RXX8_9SAUR
MATVLHPSTKEQPSRQPSSLRATWHMWVLGTPAACVHLPDISTLRSQRTEMTAPRSVEGRIQLHGRAGFGLKMHPGCRLESAANALLARAGALQAVAILSLGYQTRSETQPLSCATIGACGISLVFFSPLFCRIDWFLLDSRVIRHIAIGLFSCGLSIYLAAFAIYTLLLFRYETGITNACILSSAIIVLVMMVLYAIVRAPRVLRRHQFEL